MAWYACASLQAAIPNPVTGDYIILPPPISSIQDNKFTTGFALDAMTNEYKVVRMRMTMHLDGNSSAAVPVAAVYTVGNPGRAWRNIGTLPYFLFNYGPNHAVNMNGANAIHWLGQQSPSNSSAVYPEFIIAWDVTEEKFYGIPLPQEILDPHQGIGCYNMCLTKYKKFLSIFQFYTEQNMSIWMLEDYYSKVGKKGEYLCSWIKEEKQIPSIRDWVWDEC
ncbi:hypothetical protein ACLOJK_025026 [Asimina triloba]